MPLKSDLISDILSNSKNTFKETKLNRMRKEQLQEHLTNLQNEQNGQAEETNVANRPDPQQRIGEMKDTIKRLNRQLEEQKKETEKQRREKFRFVDLYQTMRRHLELNHPSNPDDLFGTQTESQWKNDKKKAVDNLRGICELIIELNEEGHINEKANVKLNDEVLKVYNNLNGKPTFTNRN